MKKMILALALFAGAEKAMAMPQPDLYPNAHLKQVGPNKARADINSCSGEAMSYESSTKKRGALLGDATRSAARGAAKGALAGAIVNGKAGRGAGAGAAVGGLGAAGDQYRENRDGSPEYRKYVEACLEDKGYKVIGWK